MIEVLFLAVLGTVSYRIRGGMGNELVRKLLKKPEGWEIPNGIIRAQWALLVTTIICLRGDFLWASPFIFGLAFFGVAMGYWGKFNLGDPANRTLKNYSLLTLDGMKIMAPLALFMNLLGYFDAWGAVVAGMAFVPFYLLGYAINKRIGSTYGEAMLGAAILVLI